MSGNTTASYASSLSINTIRADVRLGIGEQERATPQSIEVDVRFYHPSLMSSATDDNGEYICYHGISEKIYALCTGRQYRLIEFLIQEIYRLVRTETPDAVKIWIRLHKARILLPYVQHGASVTYTDLPPFSWIVPQ